MLLSRVDEHAGYGNIAPATEEGKIATIFYAIIGMPLFLLYLSNIGNLYASFRSSDCDEDTN